MVPAPSARLRFREMTSADLDDMAALLGDPRVMEFYPATKSRDDAAPMLEVGYHVRTALHGQGYATEAAAACRDFARTEIDATELVAIIHPDNTASEKVAHKIGMTRREDDHGGPIAVRTVLGMTL